MSRSKWVVLGVVLSAVLGLALWSADGDEVPPAIVSPTVPSDVSSPPPPPAREEFDSPPDVLAPAVPSVPLPVAASPAVPTPRPAKHPVDPEALARETALLDRARAEVKADPQLALKILNEHEQVFPAPALEKEAQLVRIEALLRLSRRPEAEEVARRLTTRDPAAKKPVDRLFQSVRPR